MRVCTLECLQELEERRLSVGEVAVRKCDSSVQGRLRASILPSAIVSTHVDYKLQKSLYSVWPPLLLADSRRIQLGIVSAKLSSTLTAALVWAVWLLSFAAQLFIAALVATYKKPQQHCDISKDATISFGVLLYPVFLASAPDVYNCKPVFFTVVPYHHIEWRA